MFKKEFDRGTCPFMAQACIGDKCQLWTRLVGKDPQTGQDVDKWDCSIKWLPILLVENSKEARHTAAAVESSRNEMVKRQEQLNSTFGMLTQLALESKSSE